MIEKEAGGQQVGAWGGKDVVCPIKYGKGIVEKQEIINMSNEMNDSNENFDGDFSKKRETVSASIMWSTVIEYGRDIVKTGFLINAGALIAILAFFGTIVTSSNIDKKWDGVIDILPDAMIGFIIGIICSGLSMLCAYYGQIFYFYATCRESDLRSIFNFHTPHIDLLYKKSEKRGNKFRKGFLFFMLLSYLVFVLSCYYVYSSLP